MSELQVVLLMTGIGVAVVFYALGWWQQRQYRKRFGEVFRAARGDALYAGEDVWQGADGVLADIADQATGHAMPVASSSVRSDDSCSLQDERSDYIIELHLAEASLASVLGELWQRKFDFGKPVQVCGQAQSGEWERVIAESPALYGRFRIALQLVDRSGVISAAKLADFRDLVMGIVNRINADAKAPEIDEVQRRAIELDAFCSEVDQMVGVNLLPPGERLLLGARIAQSATMLGMTLESDGAFHLLDAQGHSLFILCNRDVQPFQHHLLETSGSAGITLLLDVPRVEHPTQQFDRMIRVAQGLAKGLQANLVDDKRLPLNERGLSRIRERIGEVEDRMIARGVPAGSAQARRLFS